jgi:hypothetical protein
MFYTPMIAQTGPEAMGEFLFHAFIGVLVVLGLGRSGTMGIHIWEPPLIDP